jgi:hypothetical protein
MLGWVHMAVLECLQHALFVSCGSSPLHSISLSATLAHMTLSSRITIACHDALLRHPGAGRS